MVARDKMKSQFSFSFWRSNFISCERFRRTLCKSQFYFSFWRSNRISCETVARDDLQIANLAQFLAIEPHFVRKSCAGRLANRNFTAVFGDRTSFRAKELRWTTCKSQFYRSFWRSNLISCKRVAFRAVSLALPRAFKREIEKKGKGKRARGEDVKM